MTDKPLIYSYIYIWKCIKGGLRNMGGLGSELIVFLVIFLVIGGVAIAASFGKKKNDEPTDSEKNMDEPEWTSVKPGHKKNKKNN